MPHPVSIKLIDYNTNFTGVWGGGGVDNAPVKEIKYFYNSSYINIIYIPLLQDIYPINMNIQYATTFTALISDILNNNRYLSMIIVYTGLHTFIAWFAAP